LGVQLVAVATTWTLGLVGSYVLLKVVQAVVGLRVSGDQELEGLDLALHGETGYSLSPASGAFAPSGGGLHHSAPSLAHDPGSR
jgi:Amt family ammonium transporter